ncbi:MAG: 16S rRNA (adenine(1518)-N(6)/adenine(1519)-N(6))-dimethyltransferase RsmA [Burkholderiaceae bacterium]|nr:16S rRNA (adenine(1518)-N(6)/adenine(1519)-N(6))-dimethyltransferase RsmA [Burkholderiaceae bacterium]
MKHVARKRFGQHFLVDASVVERIVQAISPRAGDRLVEIGPGTAALTAALLARVDRLTAIEIDRDLVPRLAARFGERIRLIEADVLTVDFDALGVEGPIRVAGNLPYNISTPLLVRLLASREVIVDQHFMLQKEVVDRIVAPLSGANYGRLSVLLQSYYDVESLFDVAARSFEPAPRVESAVIRMLPRADPSAPEPHSLSPLLAVAFGQRRKMLRNTLLPWLAQLGVEAPEIAPSDRAQDVPVAVYKRIASRLARRDDR